jgi:hypothetical protein
VIPFPAVRRGFKPTHAGIFLISAILGLLGNVTIVWLGHTDSGGAASWGQLFITVALFLGLQAWLTSVVFFPLLLLRLVFSRGQPMEQGDIPLREPAFAAIRGGLGFSLASFVSALVMASFSNREGQAFIPGLGILFALVAFPTSALAIFYVIIAARLIRSARNLSP